MLWKSINPTLTDHTRSSHDLHRISSCRRSTTCRLLPSSPRPLPCYPRPSWTRGRRPPRPRQRPRTRISIVDREQQRPSSRSRKRGKAILSRHHPSSATTVAGPRSLVVWPSRPVWRVVLAGTFLSALCCWTVLRTRSQSVSQSVRQRKRGERTFDSLSFFFFGAFTTGPAGSALTVPMLVVVAGGGIEPR